MTDRELAELVKRATKAEAPRHGWYLFNASFGFIREAIGRRKLLLGIPSCFSLSDEQRLELEIGLLNDKARQQLESWARTRARRIEQ